MVAILSLILAGSAIVSASAVVPQQRESLHKRLTSSSTGTSGGYYYSFWTEEDTGVDYENGDDGEYTVTWESSSIDFVAGKGWEEGSDRSISFEADFSPDGNAYLSVYGWTTSPLVEYYILENYGDYDPSAQLTYVGTLDSDGSTYDVYQTTRTDAASIEGDGETFSQYWSIRQDLRSSGTVTTANHFDAWASLGLTLGSFTEGAYQIVATEGYESSGTSTVTVT
ncbi:family 11 glycoside hydrolase, partial [Cryphonectria parasitica EP155]